MSGDPFYGSHQAGVMTPQPAAALVVAFDVLAEDRGELERLFRILTERIAFLMQGGDASRPATGLPAAGFRRARAGHRAGQSHGHGVGRRIAVRRALRARGAEGRAISRRCARFPTTRWRRGCATAISLLQFCANTAETNIHALRDILKNTPDLLAPRWKIDGFLPPRTARKLGQETVRNLLGFKDGTANLDASDAALMDEHGLGAAGADEPDWTHGGSYQVVRVIRMFVERWDRTALAEQETIIGREKASGAPLGAKRGARRAGLRRRSQGQGDPAHGAYPSRQSAHSRTRRRTAFCAGATITRADFRAPGSWTWGCCLSASRPISPPASWPCRID